MDGRGIAAALALGAHGGAARPAFLACPESGASPAYKAAVLAARGGGDPTVLTRVLRAPRARPLEPVQRGRGGRAVLPYPQQNALTAELRRWRRRRGLRTCSHSGRARRWRSRERGRLASPGAGRGDAGGDRAARGVAASARRRTRSRGWRGARRPQEVAPPEEDAFGARDRLVVERGVAGGRHRAVPRLSDSERLLLAERARGEDADASARTGSLADV